MCRSSSTCERQCVQFRSCCPKAVCGVCNIGCMCRCTCMFFQRLKCREFRRRDRHIPAIHNLGSRLKRFLHTQHHLHYQQSAMQAADVEQTISRVLAGVSKHRLKQDIANPFRKRPQEPNTRQGRHDASWVGPCVRRNQPASTDDGLEKLWS